MLTALGSYFTGRAAKAGLAFITSMITTGGAAVAVDQVGTGGETLTLVGYLLVGVAGGFINWVSVYMKANEPTRAQLDKGLY